MEQYYNIAGLTVTFESFGRTLEQAEPYRCEPCEKVDIALDAQEINRRRELLRQRNPDWPEDLLEYITTGMYFYQQLLNHGGMRLHSSAVVVDGRAYLFTAESGTGKSTHTGLWLQQFGQRAYILNDDKPAIRLKDGVWYAYGTPWSGKHDISRNVEVPLAGIAVVERGLTNEIEPFGGIEAIGALMKQMNRPKKAEYRVKLMQLMNQLMAEVPIWKLRCNMDPQAAIVSYEAMSGRTINEKENGQ